MPENKARELMARHQISIEDLKEKRHSLHHLRNIVRSEELPFNVFQSLVKHRR